MSILKGEIQMNSNYNKMLKRVRLNHEDRLLEIQLMEALVRENESLIRENNQLKHNCNELSHIKIYYDVDESSLM